MFTGIVEGTGGVLESKGGRLRVSVPWESSETAVGRSVSVDGCCLTVVDASEGAILFDLSPETLDRTTLGDRVSGDLVNLERGLRLNQPLDGHIVSGHIDGVGVVRSIEAAGNDAWNWWVDVPSSGLRWLVEKGSAAVDGVSLTVNEVDDRGLSFCLIPHTIEVTSLKTKRPGSRVNLEFDLLAKYVERLISQLPLAQILKRAS